MDQTPTVQIVTVLIRMVHLTMLVHLRTLHVLHETGVLKTKTSIIGLTGIVLNILFPSLELVKMGIIGLYVAEMMNLNYVAI